VTDCRVSAASLNDLTAAIIAASIAVHRALGPGLLEGAYLSCLCYELQHAGLAFEMQKAVPLVYKNVRIDCAYRVDLVVEGCILVEVKALESLAPIHSRQALTYLRFLGSPVGLILNFGARTMREGIKRVVNDFPDHAEEAENAEKSGNAETAEDPQRRHG
jgi:GxxExxY protein